MGQQILDAAKVGDEFHGGLLTHAGAARYVVGTVAHEAQNVDDLLGRVDAVFGLYLVGAQYLEVAAELGAIHEDVGRYQLSVVLVGGHHVGIEILLLGQFGQGAYHVVGLEAGHLDDGDVVGLDNLLDDGHRVAYHLGCLLTLGLVLLVGLVTEGGTLGVEPHGDVRRILFLEQLFECIDKPQNGRSVYTFGVDSGVLDECVVRAVDERVGV